MIFTGISFYGLNCQDEKEGKGNGGGGNGEVEERNEFNSRRSDLTLL